MARIKSGIKRHKQSLKARARNRHVRSTVKTAVKDVRSEIAEGTGEKSAELLRKATSVLERAGSKGVLHKKTASRKVSRLAKAVHKAAKKYDIPEAMADIGQSCACILLMPAQVREFNLAGETWHDRKAVKDPTTLVKGQRVYVLTPAGEV
ncbi:MAG: 30S ribosomal protein S20, partial [Deltaproteobacteria bacterium 37-65-8]